MKNPLTKGFLMLGVVAGAMFLAMAAPNDAAPAASTTVTFYKDVLPILQNNCQTCHRAGEVAPMSLGTYQETRPWAVAIKNAVLGKRMPPWYADPRYSHFANERKLTPEQIKTLVMWADRGAPEGDIKDRPAPVHFPEGWNIGKPDVVLEMPNAFQVPADGTIDYQYIVIPGNFTQDTWVKAAEIRPGNRAVVHHVIAFIRPPGSPWLKGAEPGVPVPQVPRQANPEGGREANRGEGGIIGSEHLVGYVPGLQPKALNDDEAKLIPAGSDIVLQLHYTANGTAGSDKTRLGLILAKNPPKLRNFTMLAPMRNFLIPPFADNYEVKSQVQLQETVTLVDMMPHMHFRGKDFTYRAIFPNGEVQTLLFVPKYDFNWQLEYTLASPIVLPKGTRIECTAHYDNSPNNPYNPDPTKAVKWGDQTWEEMMIGWFSVAVDPSVKTAGLSKFERPGTRPQPNPTEQNGTPQPDSEPSRKPGSPLGSTR
jgi:hypothetical protein